MIVTVNIGGDNKSATIVVDGTREMLQKFVPELVRFTNDWTNQNKQKRMVTEPVTEGCGCAD